MQQNGTEYRGMERNELERNGMVVETEQNGMTNKMEWNRMEWNSTEWIGVE